MAAQLTSILDRLRKSGVTDLIGYWLLLIVALWLVVNFVKDPTSSSTSV